MNWLQPKLNLRVAQKQILTPGLVQMVSVLALNRLELREMINQEIMENPVLEELAEDNVTPTAENYTDETFLKNETEKVPETEAANPFDEFDFGSFFTQYLDTGAERAAASEHEENEKPSFDKFLSSPQSLADHLSWQLSMSICTETVLRIAGNDRLATSMKAATRQRRSRRSRNPGTIRWRTWRKPWRWCRNSIRRVPPQEICRNVC